MDHHVEPLGPDAADEVAGLLAVSASAPEDGDIDGDDLGDLLWDPPAAVVPGDRHPTVVLGVRDRRGAVVGVVAVEVTNDRPNGSGSASSGSGWSATASSGTASSGSVACAGHVAVLAVHPDHRRRGVGTALLENVEELSARSGATRMVLGDDVPIRVRPGVSADDEVTSEWARRQGFDVTSEGTGSVIDTTFRAEVPEGVSVVRVIDDELVATVRVVVRAHWPVRSEEVDRAVERGTLHVAITASADGPGILGLLAHSALRTGWCGPLLTLDDVASGTIVPEVAAALVSAACVDLMVIGCTRMRSWEDPDGPLAGMGARPGPRWLVYERALG